jgi:GAF domain-containing protein
VTEDRDIRKTFVQLADTLTTDYDIYEFLTLLSERSLTLLSGHASGVMLADGVDTLRVAAASTTRMHALELLEVQRRQGPCYDAYTRSQQIVVEDLWTCAERWPEVVSRARELGLRAVVAIPLRLRTDTIGALNLFREEPGPFVEEDVAVVRAFADIAAIGILQERSVADAELRAGQLQHALDSRVLIEQAKGTLAERFQMSPVQAFESLRAYARSNNLKLHDLAREVVEEGGPDELGVA